MNTGCSHFSFTNFKMKKKEIGLIFCFGAVPSANFVLSTGAMGVKAMLG